MPAATDLRPAIEQALTTFSVEPLPTAARAFFKTLGYKSDRTIPVGSIDAFCRQFDPEGRLAHPSAMRDQWKSVHLVFQLTNEELSATTSLFKDTAIKQGLLQSYLFFAIELSGKDYARGKLTGIARQLNRIFPMPVMLLLRHGDSTGAPVLSIAVINRRQNRLHADRDVLEKVTLIRDIALTSPHRGHLDILASFAVPNLVHPQRLPINSFDALHAAWEQIFNIDLLNERFYRELANWYFWALPQVDFPADLEPDSEKRRATGLIRLLTRLIFCWFLKEKGLIPEKLFNPADLAKLLKGFDPESETSSTYYQAILQNLFFATLNQRMGKDGNGKPYRVFAKDEGFAKNRATYDVNNLYRYEALFRDEPNAALAHFADIPFLNGGLFECLDRTEDGTDKKRYLDGFSRNAKKRPHVPDRLFFDSGETADLSTAYGDTKRKAERVTGLITILNRYKFTIVENTPIDQEIALDPELLGKVFENLLASYNEETKTTARKQTGSFYTPRPIVDYMVDESLKAHLTRVLVEKARLKEPDARAGLDLLFTYTEKEHAFTPAEVAILIAAIDALKILDPACGSGAFPMGVLHKLVYILGKLDPDNGRWKQTQLAKLDSAPMREELERAFADNNDDYGRKLYLIENCLYGVDIQPIAIQITKLRFFISLVCDQKTNRNKKDNHGIRPLPNLETKFVAANSLIGLPELDQMELVDPRVYKIEAEIEELYHSHFSIQRRDQKLAVQGKVKALRKEMADLLAQSLMSRKKSEHIADWDPFDPQSSADFFDPHWMFGRTLEKGFDVVIANPPYGRIVGGRDEETIASRWPEFKATRDAFVAFVLLGLKLNRDNATIAFIIPTAWLGGPSYSTFRATLLRKAIDEIVVLPFDMFTEAYVDTLILRVTNRPTVQNDLVRTFTYPKRTDVSVFSPGPWEFIPASDWRRMPGNKFLLSEAGVAMTKTLRENCKRTFASLVEMRRGVLFDKALLSDRKTGPKSHPYFEGDVYRYHLNHSTPNWVEYGPKMKEYPKEFRWFEGKRLLLRRLVNRRQRLMATVAEHTFITNKNLYTLLEKPASEPLKVTLALLNSKLVSRLYIEAVSQATKDDFPQVTITDLLNLPVPSRIPVEARVRLVELADQMLTRKREEADADAAPVEKEIDALVYQLYGLTLDEVNLVESALAEPQQRQVIS